MNLEQFQKKTLKRTWYEKYFYGALFFAVFGAGLFFLYDVIVHQAKYDKLGTRYLGYLVVVFFTALGVSGFFFIFNRYKILTIPSILSTSEKTKAIDLVLKEFGSMTYYSEKDFFSFGYKKNWWNSAYKIFICFDEFNFYISIQGVTSLYRGTGVIDLGGTERIRKKLFAHLTELSEKQS